MSEQRVERLERIIREQSSLLERAVKIIQELNRRVEKRIDDISDDNGRELVRQFDKGQLSEAQLIKATLTQLKVKEIIKDYEELGRK